MISRRLHPATAAIDQTALPQKESDLPPPTRISRDKCAKRRVASSFLGGTVNAGSWADQIITLSKGVSMPCNIGNIDRAVRIIVGLVLFSLAFVGPANSWFMLGLIPLVTGAIGFCPVYALFGFSTRGRALCDTSRPAV
jgi:hypothetical protein